MARVDRTIQDPAMLSGKPVVRRTRIAVELVFDYLVHNPNFDDRFTDYLRLTMEDVHACEAYAQLPDKGEPS